MITAPCFKQKFWLIKDDEITLLLVIESANITFAPVNPKSENVKLDTVDEVTVKINKYMAIERLSEVRVDIENARHVLSIRVENSATNPFV